MRTVLIVVFVANLILAAVSLAVLPDRVAIHFGGGGRPDSWASREFHATIFLVLQVPFFLLFYFATHLTRGFPRRLVNIPHKDYWLREENLPEFDRKFGRYMAEFGVAIFVFFFCISLMAIQANLREPVRLDQTWFLIVFCLYMVYTVWWLVRLVRGLQVPAQQA
jgi:uncharacterized membrane protein